MSNGLQHYGVRHERYLQELMQQYAFPSQSLKQAMVYTLFPGGKRFRPLLVYLCGELLDVPLPVLDAIAVAIELIHTYSLIHDDLPAMDNDDFRRGKLSCHRAFDEATAILVGDGMQALATELLLTELPQYLPAAQAIGITLQLVKASGYHGMVSGQYRDLFELSQRTVTEEELHDIHTLKTGKLIMACIHAAILAANPTEAVASALRTYGEYLGVVFQMQDDYLDAYGNVALTGKHRASDSANQKTTYGNLYNQSELIELIDQRFNHAIQALRPFNEKAQALIDLTQQLALRHEAV